MEKEKIITLVRAVQQGDEQAATDLYNAVHKDLYYHILKTVNDPALAEDLLQDTFIEIFQTIGQLNEPAAFVAWSKQIAYHKCTAYFRKRREILADEDEDGYSVFDTVEEDRAEFIPDEALDKEDLKQTIHAMIAELPPEQRSALLMRYFDELSVKEIAEIQGVSEGTVKSRLNYGRRALQKSVEDYEKKNGVKLHCAGAIPLLLWLFREYAVANGISLTSAMASATYTAAPMVTEGVKAGAKAAGKFAVKKWIAGVAAAAVVTGGAVTAILMQNEPAEELPMDWYGYGEIGGFQNRRFELTVEEMDDANISGHLEVSYLYDMLHETEFTGTGTVEDETVVYTVTYETPVTVGTIPTYTYDRMELIYNKETDTFSFDDYIYDADMERVSREQPRMLMENAKWSGIGEDNFYIGFKNEDHLFEMDIRQMTEEEIRGALAVSYNGKTDHLTEFTGRGFRDGDIYRFEVKLETPRTEKPVIEITIESFWLLYDPREGTLTIPTSHMYEVEMEQKK